MNKILPKQLEKYFDRLWPIPRSIMGPGFRDSLKILSEVVPFRKYKWKTNEKILDWTVPKEWRPKDAFFTDPSGKKRAEFKKNNLHLVNYSVPFSGIISLSELKKHLHSIPKQEEAVPYITSYYRPYWGFCISEKDKKNLPQGNYKVKVDTTLVSGELIIGEAVLKGASKKEILFSSYLCHPSLANNELSGPLVLSFLYKKLQNIKKRKFTYRFVIVPETIGAVAFLKLRGEQLKENMIGGYQITCVGDGGPFTYKRSRRGDTLSDRAALKFMAGKRNGKILPFNPAIGSDERQYCSPGYNLPMGSLMRTPYASYEEYHTSLDNKSFIDFKKMAETIDAYSCIVKSIEDGEYWINLCPNGEPQLGPRGLFRSLSQKKRDSEELAMWWLLNYSDGSYDLDYISKLANIDVSLLRSVANKIKSRGFFEEIKKVL